MVEYLQKMKIISKIMIKLMKIMKALISFFIKLFLVEE